MGLNRAATAEEIKARFRELAKKHHPDLNKGDRLASMKMADLTSAYDTLSDPKKRAALDQATAGASNFGPDRGASSFRQGFNTEWPEASQMYSEFQDIFGRSGRQRAEAFTSAVRGEDISTQIEVDFLDAVQGCEKMVSFMAKQSCRDCRGTGAQEGTSWSKCRVCRGSGVQRVERGILSMGVPCHRCQGTGEVLDHPCQSCRGESLKLQPVEVRVTVPAGVRNLMELRVPGAGHAGSHGGKAGHLFAIVKVKPHKRFRHIDDSVHLDVPLTLGQALLGGTVEIPTLHGTTEQLGIRAPTQPGATKILRGMGPPRLGSEGRGHLVLHFVLGLPSKLSKRQVELIEEFDALAKETETETKSEPSSASSEARFDEWGVHRRVQNRAARRGRRFSRSI